MPFAVITFALVFGILGGAYWLFVIRPEDVRRVALKKRLRPVMVRASEQASVQKGPERLSAVGPLNALLVRRSELVMPLARLIEQSGKKVTVGTILLASGVLFLGGLLIVLRLSGFLSLALLIACLLAAAPTVWIKRAADKRVRRFEELFPEAVDLIVRALRAGHAFTTGLAMVAEEMADPVAKEFRTLYDRQNYGLPLPDGLREMAANVPILDVKFFVIAVLTQREVGGNLAEVLENIASVMRERFTLRREVRTKSAHGRLTGWILAALPPVLALLFFLTSPHHMEMLLTDSIGVRMIVGAAILQVIGTLVIRRIVNLEY